MFQKLEIVKIPSLNRSCIGRFDIEIPKYRLTVGPILKLRSCKHGLLKLSLPVAD